MDEEKLFEWIREDLSEIKNDLTDIKKTLSNFMTKTCLAKHEKIDNRFNAIEKRMYLFLGGFIVIVFMIQILKDPIIKILGS